jgi:hypothetical protein
MNDKLYEALEICLNALETGAAPESVLRLFPEMKDELLPLLEASRQARLLAIPEVPAVVLRRNRARVLQHAASMREASAKARRQRALFAFPRLATSLAIAFLFLFSGTGLVRASGGALPGDNLYPVKRTWEDVRLLLVFNPESREELESEFEQERLHEVDELLAEGRHETITFAGVVTEQNGDLWVVSGVPVQITPESRLPGTPVTVGTSIMLQGRTNAQGFVEAEYIEVLGSNILLPTGVPTEIESPEDNSGPGNSGAETNENSGQENENDGQDEDKSGPSNEDQGDDNSDDNSNEHDENNNSGTNENNNEDHSDEDRSGNGSGEDHNDSSGSGSGEESHD